MGTEESRIKRLRRVRTKVLGEVPKSRDSFKPQSLLSKLPGGQNIIILDSNNDLPSDWVERCSQVPSNNPNKCGHQDPETSQSHSYQENIR